MHHAPALSQRARCWSPVPSPAHARAWFLQDLSSGEKRVVKKIGACARIHCPHARPRSPYSCRRHDEPRGGHPNARNVIAAISDMSDDEKRQAKQEVALLSALKHPCIVAYHGSFIQDKCLHIVMQYCENGDLATRIKAARHAKKYFDEEQVLDWFTQLVRVRASAHAKAHTRAHSCTCGMLRASAPCHRAFAGLHGAACRRWPCRTFTSTACCTAT
ncbi:hypothetical protein EON62_04245 [archaeon]|nr:MAG: hypothetical protein EON62_04245 [archaeon]